MRVRRRRSGSGLIHHSDHGAQYTSLAFTRRLEALGIAGSMGAVGGVLLDNAVAERFDTTRLLDRPTCATRDRLRMAFFEYVERFYNGRRHSALGYLSPSEYQERRKEERKVQPSGRGCGTTLNLSTKPGKPQYTNAFQMRESHLIEARLRAIEPLVKGVQTDCHELFSASNAGEWDGPTSRSTTRGDARWSTVAAMAAPRQGPNQRRPVTVRDVLALPAAAGAEVVAGHRGINRPVRWVHVSELLDIGRLLTGGEFLLTTGMRFRDATPDDLRTYVESLVAAGVAAVGLELVQWVHEPPTALVEACDHHGLPLVVWRSEVRFRLIAEEVTLRILDNGRRPGFNEDDLAEMLLVGPWTGPLVQECLDEAGLEAGSWVALGVIQWVGPEPARNTEQGASGLEQVVRRIRQAVPRAVRGLAGTTVARLASSGRGEIAKVILTGPSAASLRNAWDALIPMLRSNSPNACKGRPSPLRIGVSRPRDSLDGLHDAWREAIAVVRFQSARHGWSHVHFDQMRLGQLLLMMPERALRSLIDNELGALLKTPKHERSELLRTLSALLEQNFNVSATSKVLHLRRQSLYRRLARLEELLGPGFDQCDRRAMLLLALRASQLLGLYSEPH